MSPEFAAAVDPVFTYVLSVMDEIESGSTPLPEEINARIRGFIDQAEHRLGNREEWELAKYALITWVDDLLIEAPWEGRTWWEENRMEFQVFRTAEAFTKFYSQANQATELPRKDALEVFYVCVVLGFRGFYGDPSALAHADDFGLPASLEEWARRTSMSIQLAQGRPPLIERGRPGPGAPPLEGKYLLVGTGLTCVMLAVVAMVTAWQVFGDS